DGPLLRLALAAYSFKPHFAFHKGKAQEPRNGKEIDMFGFIDFCAKQRCGAELTSYFFPPKADEAYFRKVKRHAFLNGVPIVGTAIGNNFTMPKGEMLDQQIADAKLWIELAAVMGAPHIRFFAGKRKEWEASPENEKNAIAALQECAEHAGKFGIFVGVENHGDLGAKEVLQMIEEVESDWFGVNLDSGNFVTEDPYGEFEQCAPYAVNVQIKTEMKTPKKGVRAHADLQRVAQILKNANYRGNVVMEYEEEDSYDGVPGAMDKLRTYFGG
ncbi:sugar phosphate isomerase/epimerase, partial [Akkermansiaceae bacterium]|nr:sugar phosphate isomerase/epimerase [Akkermansiaceae bacterium]